MNPAALICTSPLGDLERVVAEQTPSHLISLLDPESMIDTPKGILPANHLRLGMSDALLAHSDRAAAAGEHAQALIDFIRQWNGAQTLVIHCLAGISRSTAAAFIALCVINEDAAETDLAQHLYRHINHAHPNRLLVRLADSCLQRSGRMSAALKTIKPPEMGIWEGCVCCMPACLSS